MNPESKEEKSQNSKDLGDNNESSNDCHMIYSPQTREMKLCGKFTGIDSNGTNFNARKCNACGTITKSSQKEVNKNSPLSQNSNLPNKKQKIDSNVQQKYLFQHHALVEENSENSKEIDDNDANGTSTNSHMIYSPQTKEMKLCGKFQEIDSSTGRKCDSCGTIVKNNSSIIRKNNSTQPNYNKEQNITKNSNLAQQQLWFQEALGQVFNQNMANINFEEKIRQEQTKEKVRKNPKPNILKANKIIEQNSVIKPNSWIKDQETRSVKRLEIVQFLADAKISPTSNEYKDKFVEYLCKKLVIEKNELPSRIYSDIYRIKGFHKSRKIGSKVERMIKQHRKFFDTEIVKFSGEIIFKMSKLGTTTSIDNNENSTDVKEPDSIGEVVFKFEFSISRVFFCHFFINFSAFLYYRN